jgi:hypothetical protein
VGVALDILEETAETRASSSSSTTTITFQNWWWQDTTALPFDTFLVSPEQYFVRTEQSIFQNSRLH